MTLMMHMLQVIYTHKHNQKEQPRDSASKHDPPSLHAHIRIFSTSVTALGGSNTAAVSSFEADSKCTTGSCKAGTDSVVVSGSQGMATQL